MTAFSKKWKLLKKWKLFCLSVLLSIISGTAMGQEPINMKYGCSDRYFGGVSIAVSEYFQYAVSRGHDKYKGGIGQVVSQGQLTYKATEVCKMRDDKPKEYEDMMLATQFLKCAINQGGYHFGDEVPSDETIRQSLLRSMGYRFSSLSEAEKQALIQKERERIQIEIARNSAVINARKELHKNLRTLLIEIGKIDCDKASPPPVCKIPGQKIDPVSKKCECPKGQTLQTDPATGAKKCVAPCKGPHLGLDDKGQCVNCLARNAIVEKGKCKPCGRGKEGVPIIARADNTCKSEADFCKNIAHAFLKRSSFNESCTCTDGFSWSQNRDRCICASPKVRSSDETQCLDACPEGQTARNNKCSCPDGQEWRPTDNRCVTLTPEEVCRRQNKWLVEGNHCEDCPSGQGKDSAGICRPCGPGFGKTQAGRCACFGSSIDAAGTCSQDCSQCTHPDNRGHCVCNNDNLVLNGYESCQTDCGQGSTRNEYGQCICDTAFSFREFPARCVSQCPPDQVLTAEKLCVTCPAGQGVTEDGLCVPCGSNEGVDANGQCVACNPGQGVLYGRCKCPGGKYVAQDGKTCLEHCTRGNTSADSTACLEECPTGQGVADSMSTHCKCSRELHQSLDGSRCLESCPQGQVVGYGGYGSGPCQCDRGTVPTQIGNDTVCRPCPAGQVAEGTQCLCAPGSIRSADGSSCHACAPDETIQDGQCRKKQEVCRSGRDDTNVRTVCEEYCRQQDAARPYWDRGQCSRCPPGTVYDEHGPCMSRERWCSYSFNNVCPPDYEKTSDPNCRCLWQSPDRVWDKHKCDQVPTCQLPPP